MAKVITFSRTFPAYHPKAGFPTFFVEKFWNGIKESNNPSGLEQEYSNWFNHNDDFIPKLHTIRAGKRFSEGEYFSPRVWGSNINKKSGRRGPYHSDQIIIGPDIKIEKVYNFEIKCEANSEMPNDISNFIYINKKLLQWKDYEYLCKNDGLFLDDFLHWFKIEADGEECKPVSFSGQIICWNEKVNY